MSRNRLKKESIEFIFPDGSVTVQPSNGNYWTKKDVESNLKLAGIEFPLYMWECFEKNNKTYINLYQGSTSAVMSYSFYLKYVVPLEVEFDSRSDKFSTITAMAERNEIFWQPKYAIQLLLSKTFHNTVKFVLNFDEVFSAKKKDGDKTIEITNEKGQTVEIGIDDIISIIQTDKCLTFSNFDFYMLVADEIAYCCENSFTNN
jgi:hypothetical protein